MNLLAALNQKVASPSELAQELGEPLGNVSYHVRILADLGCIELVGTTPRRGALEHHYRATVRPYFTDELWRQIPASVRQSITGESLEFVFREAMKAAASGEFDARDSRHMSRTPLVLDERGWSEVTELLTETLERVLELQEQAATRIADEGSEAATLATRLIMLHYTVTPGGVAEDGGAKDGAAAAGSSATGSRATGTKRSGRKRAKAAR